MSLRTLPSILIGCFLAAPCHGAEIHRWRDAHGNLHFGDQPPAQARSTLVHVQPNLYDAQINSVQQASVETPGSPKVILYSTTWCGYCTQARCHFRNNEIPFEEYDVETSRKGKRDYVRFGENGVPVIMVNEQQLQGFSRSQFDRAYARHSKRP